MMIQISDTSVLAKEPLRSRGQDGRPATGRPPAGGAGPAPGETRQKQRQKAEES